MPKESIRGEWYVFSSYKQRNKVYFLYLKCKLQQDSYVWLIFLLKWEETVETTYLERSKQQTSYP